MEKQAPAPLYGLLPSDPGYKFTPNLCEDCGAIFTDHAILDDHWENFDCCLSYGPWRERLTVENVIRDPRAVAYLTVQIVTPTTSA